MWWHLFPNGSKHYFFDFQDWCYTRELVEIQSYISRRPEASSSIDRRNNKSTDIHHQTSVDDAKNRGRLVPKVTSDMSDTHHYGEEILADTYAILRRHQFNLERIENTIATMKVKWRRGDEAMRDFTGTWFKKQRRDGHLFFSKFQLSTLLAQSPPKSS